MRKIIDGAFVSMLEARDLNIKNPMNGMFGGNRRSKAYGSSAEFADYREYVPGDDLRRIDWNLYARFEKLFLKLFVDERQQHHRIYLDASASMDYGEPCKADIALKLAAAFSYLSVQAMDRATVYTINENVCEDLTKTMVGREAFYKGADLLNSVKFYGESFITEAVTAQENPGKGDGMSIIISDFLTDADWKGAVDFLLYNKREVQLIQVLSPEELSPLMSGKVFMLDSEAFDEEDERNYKTEISRSSVKAYAEAFEYMRRDIVNFCNARNVGFMQIISDESIEKMLFLKATEAGMIL